LNAVHDSLERLPGGQTGRVAKTTMSQNLEQLKRLLAEVFQLDHAELDFGIYRIMNTKREEIVRFLDQDLLPQVRDAFQAYEAENRGAVEAEPANHRGT
jgi:adenine-specific DNA-methyltransferase